MDSETGWDEKRKGKNNCFCKIRSEEVAKKWFQKERGGGGGRSEIGRKTNVG